MAPPKEPVAKSDFLRKFENRLSVVGRDGNVTKIGDDPEPPPQIAVDASSESMGGITHMHPALLDALLGGAALFSLALGMGVRDPSARVYDGVAGFPTRRARTATDGFRQIEMR